MAENITITAVCKADKYKEMLPQIVSVVECESDLIANLANITSILKEVFGFFWVGFYVVKNGQLVLGPFQGTLACTRIKKGKGVCGCAWERKETIVVENVELFKGHIACSSLSRSEIVVPVIVNGTVVAVIDVDSDVVGAFNEVDAKWIGEIAQVVAKLFDKCER